MMSDAIIIALSLCLSLVLVLGDIWPEETLVSARWFFAILPLLGVKIFEWCGVYRNLLRSMGREGYSEIACGVIALSLVLAVAAFWSDASPIPASTPVIFGFVLCVGVSLLRVLAQSFYYWRKFRFVQKEPIAIYGAGDTGTRLAATLIQGSKYKPVAFIDDDSTLHQSTIYRCMVHRASDLDSVISYYGISKIFLSIPSATNRRRKEILGVLGKYNVKIQSVPSMSELVAGFAKVDQLREIDTSDLLQRETVAPLPDLAGRSIEGKSVIVTGGGGSIGSELCRQILRANPNCLVVYESNELALYNIDQELRDTTNPAGRKVPVYAVLGSVCDKQRFEDAIRRYNVQIVYHAAAYKHVPLVEQNAIEGIGNNVFGAMIVAESASRLGVERAILVSSDKAVRPKNVMGATKRLAELIFQNEQLKNPETVFSMVRFGNVMNSSGSVIPLFQSQIKNYGPVTVTHPDMTRYFMTICEASQLVIQAGALATGGDLFVLDMGQPLRIDDLARRMIELSGLEVKDEKNPMGDIEIVYTGLRPGEKLHEELLIEANSSAFVHPKIMRAVEHGLPPAEIAAALDDLSYAVAHNNTVDAVRLLQRAVPEYEPSPLLLNHRANRPIDEEKLKIHRQVSRANSPVEALVLSR
jgi:FlaA1/EpsC-like NDP-sugar epimerase